MRDPLGHKLNQWEASPPPGAWNEISRELGEWNAEQRVSRKLNQWEAAPPSNSWAAISGQLSPGAEETIIRRDDIPVRSLFPYMMRYAGAAAIIGVIAWFFWTSSPFQGAGEIATSAIPMSTVKEAPSAVSSPVQTHPTADDSPLGKEKPEQAEQKNPSRYDRIRNRRDPGYAEVQKAKTISGSLNGNWHRLLSGQLSDPAIQKLPVQHNDPRYIRIATNTGQPVRLSAKYAPIYHQLTYANDNGSSRYSINAIEQQLMKSPYIPDPGNLFDMLQLKDLLEEQ